MQKLKLAVITSLVLALAGSAMANNFRAADQVYVLAAASRIQGAAGAIFNQDVTITNTSTTDRVRVDVAISGQPGVDNSTSTDPLRTLPPGGLVLAPGERRTITDFAASASGLNLGSTVVNGFYVFFACRENGNCSDFAANPADFRNITVESRVFTGANCISALDNVTIRPCTFGNAYKGHPWYSFATQGVPGNLDKVVISGVVNTGERGINGFRTNIGLINASQYSSTTLRVTVFNSSGTAAGAPSDIGLGPLDRTQPLVTFFNAASFTGVGHVVIEQVGVTPTAAGVAAGCSDGCPGFFAYGVAIDNVSNDPTMLEGQFLGPLTDAALGVLYPGKTVKRAARRQ